jgi:hypothetical protein
VSESLVGLLDNVINVIIESDKAFELRSDEEALGEG